MPKTALTPDSRETGPLDTRIGPTVTGCHEGEAKRASSGRSAVPRRPRADEGADGKDRAASISQSRTVCGSKRSWNASMSASRSRTTAAESDTTDHFIVAASLLLSSSVGGSPRRRSTTCRPRLWSLSPASRILRRDDAQEAAPRRTPGFRHQASRQEANVSSRPAGRRVDAPGAANLRSGRSDLRRRTFPEREPLDTDGPSGWACPPGSRPSRPSRRPSRRPGDPSHPSLDGRDRRRPHRPPGPWCLTPTRLIRAWSSRRPSRTRRWRSTRAPLRRS